MYCDKLKNTQGGDEKMELQTMKDSKNALIGFDLISDRSSKEDLFIQGLMKNLGREVETIDATIDIVDGKLVIDNGQWDSVSFKILPDEASIFRDYLESEDTQSSIKLGGVGFRDALIRFNNKRVR